MSITSRTLAAIALSAIACHSVPPPSGDAPPQLPVLFDYRQLAGSEDLSGLAAGSHTISFDAYIATSLGMSWGPATFGAVERALKASHATSHATPNIRVTFDDLQGRADVRRVSIVATLDAPGTWVFDFRSGGTFLPVHHKAGYDIQAPETLRELGDIALASTPILLRTVGPCNHVTSYELQKDSSGLPAVKLTFSETTSPVSQKISGQANASADIALATDADPALNRVLMVHLGKDANGAGVNQAVSKLIIKGSATHYGAFMTSLTCAPGDYTIGNLGITPASNVVAPLYEAAESAFPEKK